MEHDEALLMKDKMQDEGESYMDKYRKMKADLWV